ncbi:MAG: hypothetical protein AAB599_02500 [Patescibacteria group bacterium]
MKLKVLLLLSGIFLLAYFLRILFLPQNSLTFGYDQARDAVVSQEIVKGDFKILGPPSSTPGLYHGVFYYYFLAVPYAISKSPIVAAYWVAFWNTLTVFIVFALAWFLTRKARAALLASIFFAVSWESTQYATWLSNPTIGIWTVPLIYLGLWGWIKEKKLWGPALCGVGLGLSIQADIFLAYHLPPVLLWLWVARKNVSRNSTFLFAFSLIISISTLILSEIKFGFKGFSGVLHLATAQDAIVSSRGLGDFTVLFLNQIGKLFAFQTYPSNLGYGAGIVLVLIITALITWDRNQKISWEPFLATWLFSHITVVTVGGTSTPFLNVGTGPAVSILLGIMIYKWLQNKRVLAAALFLLVMVGNLSKTIKDNPRGSTIFAIQKDMLLSKQIAVIDYTYNNAGGNEFSINSVTSPLWINIVWAYLYDWHGNEKYGYTPTFHGKDQVGQVIALKTYEPTATNFLIIEPLAGIPPRFAQETISEEDSRSSILEEKHWGELVVQKRKLGGLR